MDSTTALASPPPELVLRNGRQQGARRVLKSPITFVGSESGCDIRLTVKKVRPIHCVIATGPEGPILRAWKNADVHVNGLSVQARHLQDGDVIAIGPFEFEVRNATPQFVSSSDSVDCEEADNNQRIDRLRDLQKQLHDARAEWRSEHESESRRIASESQKLAADRKEIERREANAQAERDRLFGLRKRFIRRWKKHWANERVRLEAQTRQLNSERAALAERADQLADGEGKLRALRDVEQARIDDRWRKLHEAEWDFQKERERSLAELHDRRNAVVESHQQIEKEKRAFHRERQQLEQMRLDAAGLELRIANLRAVLTALQAQRDPPPELSLPQAAPDIEPAASERLAELERLIADVSDQRRVLIEQTDRLGEAREAWRGEERRLLREMEQLGERLRSWEDRLIKREKRASKDEDSIETQRQNLEQMRDRLDAWQSRLQVREVEVREQIQRLESELHQRIRNVERREIAMADLSRHWSERRRAEVQNLRLEHRRCARMRMKWRRRDNLKENGERSIREQQRDLAVQALALESARQQLLATVIDPNLAQRKLDRFTRRFERALRKETEMLETRWRSLQAERDEMESLLSRTAHKIEDAVQMDGTIGERLAEAESRERRLTDREVAMTETELLWRTQRESYERQCQELADEVDRLAGLLIEAGAKDPIPLARAA